MYALFLKILIGYFFKEFKNNMKYKVSEKITGFFVVLLKKVLSIFSLKIRYRIFEIFGIIGYYLIKKRRMLAINNIKNAFPEKDKKEIERIAKESYKTMGKMIMTSIFLEEITQNGNTIVENEELMRKACKNNEKAVLIVSLHLGGFEAGSKMRDIRKFYAVFRNQKNKKINDLMMKWREKGGLNSLPLHDNEALSTAINERSIIALASDHYGKDVDVTFFGRETTGVAGPVLLSMKHKIPIVLSYAVFDGDVIRVKNKKIIEIEKQTKLKETMRFNMQKIYHEFEEIIKEYPEQYMWQHNRWRNKKK